MFTKVMVADINMLGAWTESWKPGKFKCARIVLKDLVIYVRLCIDDVKFTLPHFLDKFMSGMTSQRAIDMAMYSALVVESATCDCNLEAKMTGQAA